MFRKYAWSALCMAGLKRKYVTSMHFKTHVTLKVLLPRQLTTVYNIFSVLILKRCPNFEIFANNRCRHSILGSKQELYIAWALEHKNTSPSKHFRQTTHLATLLTIWLNFFHFILFHFIQSTRPTQSTAWIRSANSSPLVRWNNITPAEKFLLVEIVS